MKVKAKVLFINRCMKDSTKIAKKSKKRCNCIINNKMKKYFNWKSN